MAKPLSFSCVLKNYATKKHSAENIILSKHGPQFLSSICSNQKQITNNQAQPATLKFYVKKAGDDLPLFYLIDVLDNNQKPIATLCYNFLCQNNCIVETKLRYISILDKNSQGKGYGSALLNALEHLSRQLNIPTISGDFVPHGDFAQFSENFYKSHGYSLDYDPCDQKVYLSKNLESETICQI